jgi:leucine dehydrogenase
MKIQAFSLRNIKEFEDHKEVNFFYNAGGLYAIVAIHKGGPQIPSFGATRLWQYHSFQEALIDVLKLSKTMTYKATMAGLPYGGAKGVIMGSKYNLANRKLLFSHYSEHIKTMGNFVTGADVSVTYEDLLVMKEKNSNIVGLKSDAVGFTVLGVYYGIKVCLHNVFGDEDVAGRTFAIQGVGQVGIGLVNLLKNQGAKIIIADIDKTQIKHAHKMFPDLKIVSSQEIHKEKVDVFCPCAMGGILNEQSIEELNCKIIIGGANNQLENQGIGLKLFKKGILYAPDYVVNAGGVIAVTDEYENDMVSVGRVTEKVLKIKDTLSEILDLSSKKNKGTNIIAAELAESRFQNKAWFENACKISPQKVADYIK